MVTAPACLDSNKVTSFVGGTVLVSGIGFDTTVLKNNHVSICGYPCKVTTATNTQLTCDHQGIINQEVDSTFRNEEPRVIKPYSIQTDRDTKIDNLMDGLFIDSYEARQNNIVFDFGENMKANLSQIRIFPSMNKDIKRLNGTIIEGSDDNSTYTNIMTMELSSIHPGWNEWVSEEYANNKIYRFVRVNFNKEIDSIRYVAEI